MVGAPLALSGPAAGAQQDAEGLPGRGAAQAQASVSPFGAGANGVPEEPKGAAFPGLANGGKAVPPRQQGHARCA